MCEDLNYLGTKGCQFKYGLNCEKQCEKQIEGTEDIHICHGGPLKLEHEKQSVHDNQQQNEVFKRSGGAQTPEMVSET